MKDKILRGLFCGYGLCRIVRFLWVLGFFGYESAGALVTSLMGALLAAGLCIVVAGLIRRVSSFEEKLEEGLRKRKRTENKDLKGAVPAAPFVFFCPFAFLRPSFIKV